MTSDDNDTFIDHIQATLERNGWEPIVEEKSRWVDHTIDNGDGRLGITYLAPRQEVILDYRSEARTVRLQVAFEGGPDEVVDVIVRHQRSLSDETWPRFVEDLLKASPKLAALSGEDSEEVTPITSVKGGMEALRDLDDMDGLVPDTDP